MAKSGRKITEAEVPLPRNRMLPLLATIILLLAARYFSQRNAPAPNAEAPQAEAPVQVPEAKPSATTSGAGSVGGAGRDDAPRETVTKPAAKEAPVAVPKPSGTTTGTSPLVMRGLSLRDQDGRVIYRGDIDLRPTLERIAAGHRLRFSNDGSNFQNREGRLPSQASGYYREWVVPTPDEDGPGPQRIVTGSAGDAWYTADHYRTFQKLPSSSHSAGPAKNRRTDE